MEVIPIRVFDDTVPEDNFSYFSEASHASCRINPQLDIICSHSVPICFLVHHLFAVVDTASRECAAVDPVKPAVMITEAASRGLTITTILVTHQVLTEWVSAKGNATAAVVVANFFTTSFLSFSSSHTDTLYPLTAHSSIHRARTHTHARDRVFCLCSTKGEGKLLTLRLHGCCPGYESLEGKVRLT